MRTQAAVLHSFNTDWDVIDLELDAPRAGEVLVRWEAAGLCLTDEHLRHGQKIVRLPIVGGHEGAGVVEAVGPGVTTVKPGDHILATVIPVCGRCRYCSAGRSYLCDNKALLLRGPMPDGTFRLHEDGGTDVGAACLMGSYAQYGVILEQAAVRVDPSLPLDELVVIGCAGPTGWGAVVNGGELKAGDVLVVYGAGGTGMASIQAGAVSGASAVVVVDPIEWKQQLALQVGATHAVSSAADADALIKELTDGRGAEVAVLTVGTVTTQIIQDAFDIVGLGGIVVIAGLAPREEKTLQLSSALLTDQHKRIQGTFAGGMNPRNALTTLVDLYAAGKLALAPLVTARYPLAEINAGFADLTSGKNLRGILVHEH
jgi:alcohol dehydrogenase (nicotinoprotein)